MKNTIYVIHGNDSGAMTKELMEASFPDRDLPRDARIALKPNLVVAKPASSGATTHPGIAAAVIEYLRDLSFKNIAIMEGSWVGDKTPRAFKACGFDALAEKYGVELVDLQKDSFEHCSYEGFGIDVCSRAKAADFIINLPVMKGHCQTALTCALKNMKGCIPDSEKSRFHTIGLHKPIAYLNKILKQDFIIVDGINGDLSFEEGGNPVQTNMMFSGYDPVLIDAYAAQYMGIDAAEVPYIGIAQKLGIGSTDISSARIVNLNGGAKKSPDRNGREFRKYIREDGACSACYAALAGALSSLHGRGLLKNFDHTCVIGQGFRGKNAGGIGIGTCAGGCDTFIEGCPPEKESIETFLEQYCRSR